MSKTILVLNSGSSSTKFQLFAVGEASLRRVMKGQIDGIGVKPRLKAVSSDGESLIDQTWPAAEIPDVPHALAALFGSIRPKLDGRLPVAVGHRVVHGGVNFAAPALITADVLDALETLVPLAPLHQPNNLAPIRTILQRFPDIPQVACFDTAFHRGHPELSDRYAIPEGLYDDGVRRYGFHGLSYEYIAGRLPAVAPEIASGRVIVAHLGSGASMCAICAGKSIDSTMGFTALDGLPMGTRPGQLDPGVVLYLIRQKGMSVPDVEHLLYHDCGLKALSGVSNDVRELLSSPEPRAAFAIDFFVQRIAMAAGALTARLGGIDAFVFTAGIGENSAAIRSRVSARLSWLGITLDEDQNEKGGLKISDSASKVACYVVPTDEEVMIARHVVACLGNL